jgi:flotillin
VREQQTAEIMKKQTVEVAERNKEVAVAEKERERASAQAEVLTAEAEREAAKQKVITVQVSSEADREAQKKLIAAQQLINENKIREETAADVSAYMAVKKAEAERQAAEALYQAKLRLAEADSQSATKRADGEKAIKMVDINVERERVNVEQARVEVERQSLANRSEFDEAALKFELEKLRIDAEKEVRIRAAEAMGNMMSKAQMQIFADPETMARMQGQFMRAASLGTAADGLLKSMPPQSQDVLAKLVGAVASQLSPKAAAAVAEQAVGGNGASSAVVGVPTPTDVPPVVTEGKPGKKEHRLS